MGGKGKGVQGQDDKKVVCTVFEPQAWRRNLCKNCFKTKGEHNKSEAPPQQDTVPPPSVSATQKQSSTDDVESESNQSVNTSLSKSHSSEDKRKEKTTELDQTYKKQGTVSTSSVNEKESKASSSISTSKEIQEGNVSSGKNVIVENKTDRKIKAKDASNDSIIKHKICDDSAIKHHYTNDVDHTETHKLDFVDEKKDNVDHLSSRYTTSVISSDDNVSGDNKHIDIPQSKANVLGESNTTITSNPVEIDKHQTDLSQTSENSHSSNTTKASNNIKTSSLTQLSPNDNTTQQVKGNEEHYIAYSRNNSIVETTNVPSSPQAASSDSYSYITEQQLGKRQQTVNDKCTLSDKNTLSSSGSSGLEKRGETSNIKPIHDDNLSQVTAKIYSANNDSGCGNIAEQQNIESSYTQLCNTPTTTINPNKTTNSSSLPDISSARSNIEQQNHQANILNQAREAILESNSNIDAQSNTNNIVECSSSLRDDVFYDDVYNNKDKVYSSNNKEVDPPPYLDQSFSSVADQDKAAVSASSDLDSVLPSSSHPFPLQPPPPGRRSIDDSEHDDPDANLNWNNEQEEFYKSDTRTHRNTADDNENVFTSDGDVDNQGQQRGLRRQRVKDNTTNNSSADNQLADYYDDEEYDDYQKQLILDEENKARLLKESLSDISDVFDEPLSPRALDKYRKELFDSDGNIASPKSPHQKFYLDNTNTDANNSYYDYGNNNNNESSYNVSSLETGTGSSSNQEPYYHSAEADRYVAGYGDNDSFNFDQGQQQLQQQTHLAAFNQDITGGGSLGRSERKSSRKNRRRRSRGDLDDWEMASHHSNSRSIDPHLSREEAMMEGTRMLMDNLREKIITLEDKAEKVEREKRTLGELLNVKKKEYVQMKEHYKDEIHDCEDAVRRLSAEKERLVERLKLPESERGSLRETEREISKLNKKLEDAEQHYLEAMDDNIYLKQEVKDLQTEIDEMHDQFREDEQIEFRELQRELEMNAKNCRILQFKLRKSERRNEQLEVDKAAFEEKIRQFESRFEDGDEKAQIRELEEELKMAKEVSVRLHDELELVEEKRGRYEEELDRINDILTDSENRRTSLQKEIDSLRNEVESYRHGSGTKVKPRETLSPQRPPLEKQGSSEYDLKEVMRNLQDSLERENDIKEQLEFRDEEIRTLKRRLSDFEEENETLNIQLQKMSSAKSGRYFKKPGDMMEREIVTEREHELRLQMELAEQELKVLRRKMDEMDILNETLIKELKKVEKELRSDLSGDKFRKDGNGRTEEEKIRCMAEDIERLKVSLIEKDQEADRQRRSKTKLKKSRSLEEESTYEENSEYHIDLRKQLETIQQEAEVLNSKIVSIEAENERLYNENRKLEMSSGKKGMAGKGALPFVKTDDAAMQNIDLKDKLKSLESQNTKLRDQIKSLDDRTSKLSHDVTRTLSRSHSESYDVIESRGLRSKLKTYEEECNQLKKKIADLEARNSKLTDELDSKKSKKAKKDAKKEKEKEKEKEVSKMSKHDLASKVMGMEDEIRDLKQAIANREEQNSHLETEISEYREDMDKMFSSFKMREQELIEEMESLQNKNNVISNLLDIVTERAESAQKELYKSVREMSRSPSAMSDLSGVSVGSDEVFADQKEKFIEERLEEQFMKKITWLERNLAEEKHKVQAAERRLELVGESASSSKEDKKLQVKEKEILQQEVTVAQNQLKDANKKVKELKSKLEKITKEGESLKELEDKQKEQEILIKKLKEDLDKEEKAKTKKSAAWIWEKQSLEADLKEQKKKVEELHAEVKRQQFKWKMAGEDIEREQKLKLQMQEQFEQLKKDAMRHTIELDKMKTDLHKSEEKFKVHQQEWEKEKKEMDRQQKQADREDSKKEDIIKQKDEIIQQKEDLIVQKTSVLTEKDNKIKKYEAELQTHTSEMEEKSSNLRKQEKELSDAKDSVKDFIFQVKDKDKKIRNLSEDLRKRDDRLQEKDDILQKLNRKLTDRENEVKDMDQTIRQAMKKLQERESELKTTEKTCKEFESQASEFRSSTKELKSQISKLESEQSNLKDERDKIDSELSTVKKEKRALLSELQTTKEKLNKDNEKLKKDKNKLDLELKQVNEKLHSMKATSHMKESEVINTLTKEKETLIADKHKINDELNKLRKTLQDDSEKWNLEREDLQKIIEEKTKMVKDNSKICEKIQSEMDKLKQQATEGSPKYTVIPIQHETTVSSQKKGSADDELQAKIDRQDFMYKAEKIGLEELYEGKVKNLHEQVEQAQEQVMSLKSENDQQVDLIQSSRVALADLRKRYDGGLVTWNDERDHLLKKVRDLQDKQEKIKTLEKSLEDVKTKLQKEESKRKTAENNLAAEKLSKGSTTDKPAVGKLKKDETPALAGRRDSGVSEFRAKFEKFGAGASRTKPTAAAAATKEEPLDTKGKEEAQKLVKNLQKQIKDLEKSRETDRKDLLEKVENNEKEWQVEKKKINERNKKLESQCEQLTQLQKSLVDLQYKYHEDQEKWSLERNHTHKELEDTRKLYLQEKGEINDLLAEIKKLQSITIKKTETSSGGMMIASSSTTTKTLRSGTKIVIAKPEDVHRQISSSSDEHITEYIQEVLQRISELAETCEKALPQRRNIDKPSAPPAFRRSLSSTDVEISSNHHLDSSYSSTYSSLTRQYRRSTSSTDNHDYETKTVDRHLRGRVSDKHRQSSSKYISGSFSDYGSRDTTANKGNLPKAPPSMIISPSHTPRRAKSRDRQSLSKRDMTQLYEKLGEIEHEEEVQNKALITERGHGIRVLTKSLSVDNPHDEVPTVVPHDDQNDEVTRESSKSVGKRFATIAKIHSKTYEDAPLSHTLLASIRIGELSITPGVEELTTKIRKLSKKRSDSVSPHTARKSFFDNYSFSRFSWSKKSRERTKSIESTDSISHDRDEESVRYESESEAEHSRYHTDDEEPQERRSLKDKTKKRFSKLFSKKDKNRDRSSSTDSKQKRKLFSFKRSSSVENSPVHSTVVSAGMGTLIGAPSTYEAPGVEIVHPPHTSSTSFSRESRKLGQHHRAASVDASVITSINTSDRSHSSLVASLVAQREAIQQRADDTSLSSSTTASSVSGKSSYFGRAQSVDPSDAQPSSPQAEDHPEDRPVNTGTGLFFRFGPKSASARWRSNPSFRLASEKPVVIKKDVIEKEQQVLNGKLSKSSSSFSETNV